METREGVCGSVDNVTAAVEGGRDSYDAAYQLSMFGNHSNHKIVIYRFSSPTEFWSFLSAPDVYCAEH